MRGHGRQVAPNLSLDIKALNSVKSLESISAPNNVQLAIHHSHSKLKAPTRHVCHMAPFVGS